jgi:hypothetical protein
MMIKMNICKGAITAWDAALREFCKVPIILFKEVRDGSV